LSRFSCITLIAFQLVFAGCATAPRQTEAFLKSPYDIPDVARIESVPLLKQAEYFCGPATLAMALNWARTPETAPVTPDEVADEVYSPSKKGAFPWDLISASRRRGMLAVPIRGVSALLHEVAAGHPVIVLQNLGLSWYTRWHYALVLGYDLHERSLVLHSGNDAYRHLDMRAFEQSWVQADYWGLVILPPSSLSASGDEFAHARAAAALEALDKPKEAELIYRNILSKWTDSLPALIGLGNTAYSRKDFIASMRYLQQATDKHPTSSAAWHNLATVQGAANLIRSARISALRAIATATPEQDQALRKSLQQWLQ